MRIDLEYRRDGETFSGRLSGIDEGSGFSTNFFSYTFAKMFRDVHLLLVEHRDAVVVLHRLERPGLPGYELDRETLELLRVDPVAAIKSMSPTMRLSTLPSAKRQPDQTIPAPLNNLRIGSETLADAFGDRVLLRCRTSTTTVPGQVECPKCGRYKAEYFANTGDVSCSACRFFIPARDLGKNPSETGWVSVSIRCLLAAHLARYFLPRGWNETSPWISHEDLANKYEDYLLKKEQTEKQLEKEAQL
jgi:hypothetical protein